DSVFGARPLKRVVQRFLEDPLAEDIIKGSFTEKLKNRKEGKVIKIKITRKGEILKFE
ncbi:MAG: hypothetical protein KAS05_02335, partial [Candidatus Omnitrophica bacterium]|nr:hypothetical protein [Candidatus Omnitrophota bacterium]